MPDAKAIVLPNEEIRHRRSLMAHRPIGMDTGPRDPWARMFVAVAGDLVPLDRRRRWVDRPMPKEAAEEPPVGRRDAAAGGEGSVLGHVLDWLKRSNGPQL
jgi:hypothetical protein